MDQKFLVPFNPNFRLQEVSILNKLWYIVNQILTTPRDHLSPEPVFVKVYGAQESIPRNRFRQAENRYLVSLKDLQIRALDLDPTEQKERSMD